MDYAGLKAAGLAIGSGFVEATCKTLVAQRLKLSGMRWGASAQAILTPRSRALLAVHYRAEVHVLAKVIPFTPPRPPRRVRGAG
ncbi:MAG: hypothetical protein IPI49_00320 [Myxococcales bacterium]|nr:hypothetical protein [Myxococcales bacterium]